MEHKFFISHSSADRPFVNWLASKLKDCGIPVWYSDWEIPVGAPIPERINAALKEAAGLIVVLSKSSVSSKWVREELNAALALHLPIFPIRLDDCAIDPLIESRRRVDFSGNRDRAIRELVESLKGHRSPEGIEVPPSLDRDRIRGIFLLIAVLLSLLLLYVSTDILPVTAVNDPEIAGLLHSKCWIGYDPLEFDPDSNPDPSIESMERDLRRIREAGFTGIVTFGSRGTLAEIPTLAKREGLAAIMGVWNPKDETELRGAVQQKDSVIAYCVGHGRLNWDYSYEILEKAIARMRKQTGRPVTTSEEIRMYRDNRRLIELGDWLFPDSRLSFRASSLEENESIDAARDIRHFTDAVQEIAAVAKRYGRPLMLKVVTYPWNGIDGTSLEIQRKFFRTAMEFCRDPSFGPPLRISVMVHSAFDSPFKNTGRFKPWDSYTGLLDSEGAPRPAVKEVINRCP